MSNRVDRTALQRAEKILRANLPPRYYKLDRLDRYVSGTQYDHKPSWWDDSVPLFDRAPCVVYPIARDAIRSNVDLVLGDGRFPKITSLPCEDDEAYDDELGLSPEDSEVIDRGICALLKQTRAHAVFRQLLEAAQACGTAVVIGGVREGKVCLETTKAKWCTTTFDTDRPGVVTVLEIRYPWLKEVYDKGRRKHSVETLLYRRVIDERFDTTFKPARANEHGDEPDEWQVDVRVEHGLGFCPVVWYKHAAECSMVSEVDGRAVHAELLDEIDALNFALSQRHRACLYAGDPQLVETGVDEDVNPAPMGAHSVDALMPPFGGTAKEPDRGAWRSPGVLNNSIGTAGVGRKKGPGVIYRYPSEKSKLSLLTLPGDALKSVEDNAKALMVLLREALAYVSTDPDSMKMSGDLSGRFLEWLYRKQLNRCDDIRVDFGDHCILPVVDMMLRIALAKAGGIHLPGAPRLAEAVAKFVRDVADNAGQVTTRWVSPELHLVWGPYFPPTEADQKLIGDGVRADVEAGLITKATAVEKLALFYGIKSVPEYLESLEREAQEKMARMHDAASALQAQAGGGRGETDDEGDGAGAVSRPPENEEEDG